jgi:hypothetical protein
MHVVPDSWDIEVTAVITLYPFEGGPDQMMCIVGKLTESTDRIGNKPQSCSC